MENKASKIRNDGDLVSYIPYSLGFVPHNSIVVMSINGTNLELMARFDAYPELLSAPDEEQVAWVGYLHTVFHNATPISADAQYAIVMYVDAEGPGGMEGVQRLRRVFHVQFSPNCDLKEDACRILTMIHVREDAWQVLYFDGSTSEPHLLHDGVDAESAVSADMVYQGQTYAPSVSSLVEKVMNSVPVLEPKGIDHALAEALAAEVPERWDLPFLSSAIQSWEAVVSRLCRQGQSAFSVNSFNSRAVLESIAGMDAAEAAALYASVRSVQVRDALLVLSFFGGEITVQAACILNSKQPVLEDEVWALDLFGQVFTGEGLGATEAIHPDAEMRIATCMLVIKSLLTLSATQSDPALLTILAWESWRRGRGSIGGHYVDRALNLDPEYNLAKIQLEMIERGITFSRGSYVPIELEDRRAS